MPVKSLYSGAARKVARLLCPLLCPSVDGHAGGSRGGIGSERAALQSTLSRDVRCVDRYNRKGSLHDGAEPSILTHLPHRYGAKVLTPPFQLDLCSHHWNVPSSRRCAPHLAVLDAPAAMLMTKAHRMAILAYLFKEVRASTARLADGLAPGGRHGPL